ncbi:MAG TPA: NAD-dependent epimerase/dehydratase family protein, partial [Panacibacter sp.]|nr:NAD-dependent epimerase/dehydratase family protein [Panacibacter sp.]
MKILITGANGFLGQHLTLYLAGKGFSVIACSRGICRISEPHLFQYISVDLTDASAVSAVVAQVQPDVIIHSAAMSKPDECEADKNLCILHNVLATKFLLNSSKPSVRFIYI